MIRFLFALIVIATPLLLSSCADTQDQTSTEQNTSSIPWNRPEKWEGQGMMPGFQQPH
jgi:hypothetical protein